MNYIISSKVTLKDTSMALSSKLIYFNFSKIIINQLNVTSITILKATSKTIIKQSFIRIKLH